MVMVSGSCDIGCAAGTAANTAEGDITDHRHRRRTEAASA